MQIIAGRALVSDRGSMCTIGAAGYDTAGTPHIITAGHAKGAVWRWHGGHLGTTAAVRFRPLDARSIRVENGSPTALVDMSGGQLVELTGFETPKTGLRVVRVGAKSLRKAGRITHVGQEQCYDLGPCVKGLFRTDIASARGDSGGPVITEPVGGAARLVGFTSGGWISPHRGSVTFGQPAEQAFEALGLCPLWKICER